VRKSNFQLAKNLIRKTKTPKKLLLKNLGRNGRFSLDLEEEEIEDSSSSSPFANHLANRKDSLKRWLWTSRSISSKLNQRTSSTIELAALTSNDPHNASKSVTIATPNGSNRQFRTLPRQRRSSHNNSYVPVESLHVGNGDNQRVYEMIPEPNLWNTDRGLDEVNVPPTDLRHFHSNSNTSSSTMTMTNMGDPCRTLLRGSTNDAGVFKEEMELHHQQQVYQFTNPSFKESLGF
jgi:hypothetical protein